ncbi:MAG: ferritin-like domain-containing protein, partial [Myxococcota bacterium]
YMGYNQLRGCQPFAEPASARARRHRIAMADALPERQPLSTESTQTAIDAVYNWNYEPEIDQLRTLYANALDRQWIAVRDLDWERGVDRDAFARSFSLAGFPIQRTQFWKNLDPDLQWQISRRTAAFMLSNFLHGEQGALMAASQMVTAVPHMDAKFYAATQTIDEARHVEVFAAFIRQLDEVHPIMPSLKSLLDRTLATDCWMAKAVGMQIVVEGLALYVFRDMRNTTEEPLLEQLLTLVSRDEARHTAFGIKYLSHVVGDLCDAERERLEDFAFEAARLLVDSRTGGSMRQSALQIWSDAGLDPQTVFAELRKERENLVGSGQDSAGPIRGFVIPTLRSIGLFSERMEKNFREMFGANFGEERAKQMNLHADLPDDLDAWVEARV